MKRKTKFNQYQWLKNHFAILCFECDTFNISLQIALCLTNLTATQLLFFLCDHNRVSDLRRSGFVI